MHELGIAEAALRAALEETRVAGATRVARIVLRVGEFSGVDAEALRFAFTAIQPGTAAEGAALEIEPVVAVASCPGCRCDFSPGSDFLFECPGCGRISTAIKQGRELEVSRLEVY
jgi:hydrogenase nickel incorporation protein HypA/HybF